MVFAIPLEDVRCGAGAEGASSGSGAKTGAAGATGIFRRLLALMLKEATPLVLSFPADLLAASCLTCRSISIIRRAMHIWGHATALKGSERGSRRSFSNFVHTLGTSMHSILAFWEDLT